MSSRALANQSRELQIQRLSKMARSLLLLVATILSFSVIALLMADRLYRPESFVVDQLKLRGKFRYLTPTDIESKIDTESLGNFFSIDLNKIKKDVESIAWVQSADVRREWPNTLLINLEEHRPVMSWKPLQGITAENKNYWLTSAGEVVALADEVAITNPIELSGNAQDSHLILAQTYQWKKQVEQYGMRLINVNLSNSHAWQLVLQYQDNEFEVLLGRTDSVQRLSRFLHLFDNQFRDSDQLLTRVDARYPNGLAIKSEKIEAEKIIENEEVAVLELNNITSGIDKNSR